MSAPPARLVFVIGWFALIGVLIVAFILYRQRYIVRAAQRALPVQQQQRRRRGVAVAEEKRDEDAVEAEHNEVDDDSDDDDVDDDEDEPRGPLHDRRAAHKARKRAMREQLQRMREAERQAREQREEARRHAAETRAARQAVDEEAEAKAEKLREQERAKLEVEREAQRVAEARKSRLESERVDREFRRLTTGRRVIDVDYIHDTLAIARAEIITRINALGASGDIHGIFDDRGRFIVITDDEMNAVAAFVRSKGRVSVEQLRHFVDSAIHIEDQPPDAVP